MLYNTSLLLMAGERSWLCLGCVNSGKTIHLGRWLPVEKHQSFYLASFLRVLANDVREPSERRMGRLVTYQS